MSPSFRAREPPLGRLERVDIAAHRAAESRAIAVKLSATGSVRYLVDILPEAEPLAAGIDPYRKLIERQRGDNVGTVRLETK